MTTREQLADLCAAIFGPEWVSPLARTLNIGLRTAQRWASGVMPVPDWVWDSEELKKAAQDASSELAARLELVRAHLSR